MDSSSQAAARILFLGSTYAGHATRFANLRHHVEQDARVVPVFRTVTGWNRDGRLERFPLVPRALKGRARAVLETSPIARLPRPDAIWTSCREELAPYFFMQSGPLRRPLVLDLDATDTQLESMAPAYFGRSPKRGWRAKLASTVESLVHRQVTLFTPWSQWAASGLEAEGVDPSRIHVIPPGVDLTLWHPTRRNTDERPLRLLFVGGDFKRKGGDLILEAVGGSPEAFEATLVTRDEVGDLPPGARLVRAAPNSPELRGVFDWADVFVLPTRAECFGIATVEAMAAGLPAIVSDVGGARDIVLDGVTGWVIEPTHTGLSAALAVARANRAALPAIGARARERAERRFDGQRNDRAVFELLLSLTHR